MAVISRLRSVGATLGVVTHSTRAWRQPGAAVFRWDLAAHDVPAVITHWDPEFVIHSAAITSVDYCETHPRDAFAVNAEGSARVTELASQVGARLVYISTDSVFDGERGRYTDTDPPHPINVYAATKLAGERLVGEYENSITVRVNFVGGHESRLTDWILTSAKAGAEIPVFRDVVFNPVEVRTFAKIVVGLLRSPVTGTCHVASDEGLSKAEYAFLLLQYAGLDTGLLKWVNLSDVPFKARRPLNTTLVPSSAVVERFAVPSLDEAIRLLAAESTSRT